jgi:monoamine oxidase
MSQRYYDIIIIGSGIAGLYAAYNIQKMSPSTSFIILEKYKQNWIGGRTSNDTFYGTQVVTGAGIGRKIKDKLLINLLNELDLPYEEFPFKPYYSSQMDRIVDVKKVIEYLKNEYNKNKNRTRITFKAFAKPVLGDKLYNLH